MTVPDENAEPIEHFFIGCRRWLGEQDARRVAGREKICGRGSSGNLVIEDCDEICRSRWSLFDEEPTQLSKNRLVLCPEGSSPEEQ